MADELAKLYDVANDYECGVLDGLLIKAGLRWNCVGDRGYTHWTNLDTSTHCEECGRPRP